PNTDHRADLYAFGILAYEILTGHTPFGKRSPAELLAAQVTEPPQPIADARPNLPPALAALVMRCLQKRPADRPQSAGEILQSLDEITTPSAGTTPTRMLPPATTPPAPPPASGRAGGRRNLMATVVIVASIAVMVGTAGVAIWRSKQTTPRAAVAEEREERIA